MKKILILTPFLLSLLFADTHLGKPISVSSAEETIVERDSRAERDVQHLNTRVSPDKIKAHFKKDHHRYDKRYSNFNYEDDAYYNDDGYYYGYYDTTGYFFNNIFFSYSRTYTYNDRCYRRGHFRESYPHHRRYIHHNFNNWNQIHCYAEPNHIVYGHYYDNHYYHENRHHSNYYESNHHYRTPPARMSVTRMNTPRTNVRVVDNRHYNNHYNSHRNHIENRHQPRSVTRMTTRNSHSNNHSNHHISRTHMQLRR